MHVNLAQAYDFIFKNARLLERQLFAWIFEGGSREAVLHALLAYQNADGGFGNALEPDKRDPGSQPVDVDIAFHLLEKLDAFDHPCVLQACDFLARIAAPEGGVPFALPSVMGYPRAPWWNVPPEPPASLNPTASLAGILLAHNVQHPWLDRALPYCWQAIAGNDSIEYHDLMPMIAFLQHAPETQRAAGELERIRGRIIDNQLVSLDPAASGYVHPPLDWAPMPHLWTRSLFSDAVLQADLNRLIAQQQADGGWPISWQPVSTAVELEWRGCRTVEALSTLKAYGVKIE